MSKSIEALNRIETIAPFNRENKPNYYRQFMQSETPFYEDFDLVKKDLERLEKLEIIVETLKKAFLLGVGEFHGVYYVLAHDNNYCMTKEEYDLLKEELENGN